MISSKPTSGESEGRTATKAFRKRGFNFSLTTKPQGTTAGTGRTLSRDVQGSAIGQLLGEAAVWL